MKKKERFMMKKLLVFVVTLVCLFSFSLLTEAATVPNLKNGKYIKTYPLSSRNNTYVYTSSNLSTRGTSSPFKKYNSVIYANDEVYIYKMTYSYCYVSFPTSSGRRYGYVRTSSLTGLNSSESPYNSQAKITTYKRAGGASYGSISKGDRVCTAGVSGNYTQVIYPVGNNYKMGWITTSDYKNYIKPAPLYESYINNGTYIFHSAMNSKMVIDVNGAYKTNGTNIHLWEVHYGNNQIFEVTRLSSGWYRIKDINSGRVLDVAGGVKKAEVNIQLYDWNGTDAQLFKFYSAGNNTYFIQNKLGYFIDVYNGQAKNGANIQVYSLNKGNNQRWSLSSIDPKPIVVPLENQLVSQTEINSAASRYKIATSSNQYKALGLINSKYYNQLKGNKDGINVFLFEGVGANASASQRFNAMCVVVKNKKIVYINKYCSTIPDNPFKPSLNDGKAVPTLLSGVYNFSSKNHNEKKSVSDRYIPYAALHVNGSDTNVLRHSSESSYYKSNSDAINVHGRSGKRTNSTKNSVGCIIVGDIFGKYPNEYADFIKAVGVVPSTENVSKATKCIDWPTGKLIIDRSYAYSYLKDVGYSVGAINILVK